MSNTLVFYSRCKPQGVDALEIVREHKKIFIGYPMARDGAVYDPRNLRSCVVDPSCPEDEWRDEHQKSQSAQRFYSQNRNIVAAIGAGSIALVPRPSLGVIYVGRIVGNFELVDNPPWYDRYMEIRKDEDIGKAWHAADVAQCWSLDQLKPVPVPRIPAWIRRSLFGRSTYGIIHRDELNGDPHEVMSRILDDERFAMRPWTLDAVDIEKRMLEDLTPTAFEHLAVSLLQLENPHEIWTQVGGSGDGGVDGIGADQDGGLAGMLQCKWQYWGEDPFPEPPVWKKGENEPQKYLAALRYNDGVVPRDCRFLNRQWIAEMVLKHRDRLPQAISLRVGSGFN